MGTPLNNTILTGKELILNIFKKGLSYGYQKLYGLPIPLYRTRILPTNQPLQITLSYPIWSYHRVPQKNSDFSLKIFWGTPCPLQYGIRKLWIQLLRAFGRFLGVKAISK